MSLGERILELRKAANMSQADLARAMDVSRQAVSKWETDQSSPDASNLILLSDLLESNRTYVGEAFKQNVGMTFTEYISHRRIDYVAETLKSDPQSNLNELFNYVG